MSFWNKVRPHYKMYSRQATAQVGVKASASMTVRTAIEMILYDLACQHAAAAEAACKRGDHKEELSSSIQTIMLAAACMEGFINQEAIEMLGPEFYRYDKGCIDVHCKPLTQKRGYPSLEDKWCEITEGISNKQFDKAKQPFQGFHGLVELRNEILHYKGASVQPVPSPWKDVQGSVTPERAKFTAKAAQDAVKSIQGMLEKFHTLTGKQLPEWIK